MEIELVRLDVNECMRVRGIDGYVWNWSAFIYDPAKIALMNGQSVMAPNAMSGRSHVIGAKFAIAPDDWKRIEASASLEFSKDFIDSQVTCWKRTGGPMRKRETDARQPPWQ